MRGFQIPKSKGAHVYRVLIILISLLSANKYSVALNPYSVPTVCASNDGEEKPCQIRLRAYAKDIMKSLTSGRVQPAWENEKEGWRDQADLNLMGNQGTDKHDIDVAKHLLHSIQHPPQLQIREDGQNCRKDFPLLQTIYYNKAASESIRSNKLAYPNQLQKELKLLKEGHVPLSEMSIPDFNRNSIVVKSMWEVLQPDNMKGKCNKCASGANLFGAKVKGSFKFKDHEVYTDLSSWQEKSERVFVDYGSDTRNKQCSFRTVDSHMVYSLGCFHYRKVPMRDIWTYHALPRPLQQSPDILSGTCIQEPCLLILVGFHIMTRATPNWVWMTYWWDSQNLPGAGSGAVKDKWSLFNYDVTINNLDKLANPYLEGPTVGMKSNCIECHRFAAFHHSRPNDEINGIPDRNKANTDFQSPTDYFEGALRTHFLWTISLNADQSEKSNAKNSCSE